MSTLPTSIRPATLDDMAAIQSIYAYYVKETTITFEYDVPDTTEMTKRFKAVNEYAMPYLVAERDDSVVGYAYISAFRTRRAYRYCAEHSIYLHPDERGHGIGKKLLEALITAAEPTGLRQLVAVISDKIDGASVALHRKCGFEMVGTLPACGYKFERWIDVTMMQFSIGNGAETPPDGIGLKLT